MLNQLIIFSMTKSNQDQISLLFQVNNFHLFKFWNQKIALLFFYANWSIISKQKGEG